MINIDDRILEEADESQLFLLIAIAKHMGSNAKAWPSNKTLCKTTKWSPNKLQRVKKSAMEAGLLGSESRFQKSAQTSNMYQIKTRRIGVMVNLADIEPHPQNGVSPHPQNGVSPHPQNGDTEVLTNEALKNEVLTNEQPKAVKPQPASTNEIKQEPTLNENPKKPNNFTGGGAAKKTTTYTPRIHPENEPHFAYFSDPAKAKAAWTEWIEYKHTQHRQKYKEAKSELTKLRQLFQQFNGDSAKFEAAINYSIGNLYSGVFAPKIENGNGKFQHIDKAQQQHLNLARFVADIHSGAAFANTGTVDIITGEQ